MFREVTMIELKEVLRLWGKGLPKKRVAAQLGLDPKTVRRYVSAATAAGLCADSDPISDDQVRDVLLALHPVGGRPRGDGWTLCAEQRESIRRWLEGGVRLTKIRKLLARQGVRIAYPTLHRFAVLELQFGRTAPTIPVLDGDPGGTASRYGLGGVAHAAADRPPQAPALSRVDLHRRAVPLSLRLSDVRRNDRPRD
jgi:hypothetical protein